MVVMPDILMCSVRLGCVWGRTSWVRGEGSQIKGQRPNGTLPLSPTHRQTLWARELSQHSFFYRTDGVVAGEEVRVRRYVQRGLDLGRPDPREQCLILTIFGGIPPANAEG